jgi:S-adenosylmethionine synthetase
VDFRLVQETTTWAGELPIEVVERKGIGHPDSICDAIAERASALYSREFYAATGRLPHHYFDKVLLAGGGVDMGLGRGEIVAPYRLVFAGKGILQVGDYRVDLDSMIRRAACEVFEEVLVDFDPDRHLVVINEVRDHQGPARTRPRYRPETLSVLPTLESRGRVSNDCNLCTSFAPFTMTERAVLGVESFLAAQDPATRVTGTDIKVVGIRRGSDVTIVVNVPFLARRVPDLDAYRALSQVVAGQIREYLAASFDEPIRLDFNPQDASGLPYLSVTGSVADTGDLGVVGRGNRQNGLITPMRPMSIEAVSGKSPIDNTGKLYGILARDIALSISTELNLRNEVYLTTFRDRSIEDPYLVCVETPDHASNAIQDVRSIVERELSSVYDLTRRFIFEDVVCW